MKHNKSEGLLAVLIDIPPEDAAIVLTYEDAVLPLLSRHGGRLQLRVRAVDQSAELHIISFDSREGQEAFGWFGRDGRSRQVPQLASSLVAKLVVPGTDGPSIGSRGRTRCHSGENRGVYSLKAVRGEAAG